MKKIAIIFVVIFLVGLVAFFAYKNFLLKKEADYLLERSEGICKVDTDCQWAGEGCGGGHGVCTDSPGKYKGVMTTCDIVPDFPANRGYQCGCVLSLGKCGWKK